jgi:hypothetical protein
MVCAAVHRENIRVWNPGTDWGILEICLGLAKAKSEPANLALAREQAALALSA